jgi:aspartate aminotransferase-like enzyme
LPRYLDLAYYAEQTGIPFTFSSNLLHALQAALKGGQWEKRFAALNDLGPWLRASLRELGFVIVAPDECSSPAIVTLALPQDLNSIRIGNLLQESGYLLSYKSEYLQRKNWVQICLMSECGKEKLVSLLNALNRVCFRNRVTAPVK